MSRVLRTLRRWFDGHDAVRSSVADDHIDWFRCLPFLALHLACLGVLWVGISWVAAGVAVGLYLVRMFAVTGFYHRYFSHRTFKTSRPFQFMMALLGSSAVQRGPLWWAAHHRHHHNHSDENPDRHSPGLRGFWMSHMGWFMTPSGYATDKRMVRDWIRFAELRFLDRFDWLVPLVLAVLLFAIGQVLAVFVPAAATNGWQLLVWGFVISTVVLYHATYTINSLSHKFGSQPYATGDDSRNNFLLALLTLGEGWHNNHHHYPASARQGFLWWEVDLTYYGLKILSVVGLIWDLRPVPRRLLSERERGSTEPNAP